MKLKDCPENLKNNERVSTARQQFEAIAKAFGMPESPDGTGASISSVTAAANPNLDKTLTLEAVQAKYTVSGKAAGPSESQNGLAC